MSINTNDAINMYKSGKSVSEISSFFNVSDGTIYRAFKIAGFNNFRTTGGYSTKVPTDEIINLYKGGMSENALSKKFGVSRNVIRTRLVNNKVHIRSQSEAETLKWSKMSDKQRSQQVKAANKAIRNKPKGFHIQNAIKQAKQKEQTRSKVGALENAFIKEFEHKGFKVIPQKAVYVYNIDLAINNTAIEIHINSANPHGNYWYFRKRIVELLKRNWNVIYIKITSDAFVQRTANKVCAMIDLVESDHSGICHYGMIRGSSELVTSGRLNGDKLTTVDACNGFFAAIE